METRFQTSLHRVVFAPRQWVMLATPLALPLTMYVVFQRLAALLGYPLGYLAAFLIYWIGWCIVLPMAVLGGPRGVLDLFHAGRARFADLGGKTQALLWWPLIAPLGVLLSPYSKLRDANLPIIVVSLLLGLVIGVTEEILWRGVYIRLFPGTIWLNTIYPTVGFAAWHIAPLSVLPARFPGAPASFLIYCLLLGLSYAYYARKSGSIRWCTVSHCIHDALGLGGFAYALWLM